METRYLKTLIAAVEEGTFSKASESLNITQSAVSQRIKFLEDHFDQQLLDRSGPKLLLTPAGHVVLAKAREIVEKENELFSCLQNNEPQKKLSLCCTPTFGMAFLPDVLNDFFRSHSDMEDLKFIFMQPMEALRGLRNDEFDLAVIEHPLDLDFSGFKRYALPDDEMLFVVSARAALTIENGAVDLSELTAMRLYARRDGCSSKEILRKNLCSLNADFDRFAGVVVSDDLRFTINSIIQGNGVTFVSRSLVSDYMASGRLVGVRAKGFDHLRGRSVVLNRGRSEEGLINDLLESIFQVVSPHWQPRKIDAEESAALLSN
ncbi:MAG: LysR family transcriptional regulator [Deltaproteobacteria bacterium]|jgi:DNA-binding transcriptional LysR family regulator|nr:LysR family transcriptional regulator [Deltaproteobacteria bacterium]